MTDKTHVLLKPNNALPLTYAVFQPVESPRYRDAERSFGLGPLGPLPTEKAADRGVRAYCTVQGHAFF
jgi:hypothetical protein